MAQSNSIGASLILNNQIPIPQFALGTYKITDEETNRVVETALSIGYRHFDCAWLYGNEKGVGRALASQLKKGEIKRADLFLTGKIWCPFHKAERVRQQCLITINDLQSDYLDLLLIHWPFAFADEDPTKPNEDGEVKLANEIDFIETWKAMESLVDEGKVKSIGLSNFNEAQIQRILDVCKHKPVVNQVEIHPYCPQTELHEFCKTNNILLAAYAPLGAKERHWKQKEDPEVMDDKVIKSIADKYHVHPAMVLVRFILDRGIICIAKSSNEQRLRDNFKLFQENSFQLAKEDFDKIQREISTRFRYHAMSHCRAAKEFPFKDWKNHVPQQQQ